MGHESVIQMAIWVIESKSGICIEPELILTGGPFSEKCIIRMPQERQKPAAKGKAPDARQDSPRAVRFPPSPTELFGLRFFLGRSTNVHALP